MNQSERRVWLSGLLTSQLLALYASIGAYSAGLKRSREEMIENLSNVEDIEKPRKA